MLAEQPHTRVFPDAAVDTWKVARSKGPNRLHHDVNGAYIAPSVGGLQLSDFRITGELPGRKFRIFRAVHIASGQPVVLKAISKEKFAAEPEPARRRIRSEIEIHSRLQHPDVIGFLGMFHDPEHIYLVLELAPAGDLDLALLHQPGGRVDEAKAAHIVAGVARALRYSHAQGVAHRDVKPGNVLLGPGDRVRLADFGLAKEFAPPAGPGGRRPAMTLRRMHSVVGTPDFIAPDVLCPRRAGYDHKCDMWSLGTLIFQMLVGQAPFFEEDMAETYDRIARADFVFPSGKEAISRDAQQLISGLLHVDPKRRLTAAQVLTSRWVVQHCGRMAAAQQQGPVQTGTYASGGGVCGLNRKTPSPTMSPTVSPRMRPAAARYAATKPVAAARFRQQMAQR